MTAPDVQILSKCFLVAFSLHFMFAPKRNLNLLRLLNLRPRIHIEVGTEVVGQLDVLLQSVFFEFPDEFH